MDFSKPASLCMGLTYALEAYDRQGPKDLPDHIRYASELQLPRIGRAATFEPEYFYATMDLVSQDVYAPRNLLHCDTITYSFTPDSEGVMCSYNLRLDVPMPRLGVRVHIGIYCRGDGQCVPTEIQVSDPRAWIAWKLPLLPASGDWPQVIKSKEVNDMLVFFARYWKDYQKDLTGTGVMRLNRVIDCCST